MRSVVVVLPASTWAMMPMFLMFSSMVGGRLSVGERAVDCCHSIIPLRQPSPSKRKYHGLPGTTSRLACRGEVTRDCWDLCQVQELPELPEALRKARLRTVQSIVKFPKE